VPSSQDLSLAAFTINIAESNFRHAQESEAFDGTGGSDEFWADGHHCGPDPRMTERRRLIEGSSLVTGCFHCPWFSSAIENLARDERAHRDRCPTISKTEADRHKLSYRLVPPLDVGRLPVLN
jgi:hypothetical protein